MHSFQNSHTLGHSTSSLQKCLDGELVHKVTPIVTSVPSSPQRHSSVAIFWITPAFRSILDRERDRSSRPLHLNHRYDKSTRLLQHNRTPNACNSKNTSKRDQRLGQSTNPLRTWPRFRQTQKFTLHDYRLFRSTSSLQHNNILDRSTSSIQAWPSLGAIPPHSKSTTFWGAPQVHSNINTIYINP